MNYNECVNYILNVPKFSKKTDLKQIKVLLNRLGNPENYLKVIHVAGTNGKGSVCSMLASIYIKANYKVGLFTSPHLISINERIKINFNDISNDDFKDIFNHIYNEIKEMLKEGFNHPTFFEILFAMAVLYFKQRKVDVAILETGLGGRLDATNCIEKPIISIITKLSYDHMNILGNTIEEIAYEKAGIIKEGIPTVYFGYNQKIDNIIKEICSKRKSKFYQVSPINYKILKRKEKSIDFSLNNHYYNYKGLKMSSIAEYQIQNLAIVLLAIQILQNIFPVNLKEIYEGIKDFQWYGRMEVIQNSILLDGAHNEDGIKEFVNTINKFFFDREIYLMFMVMKDKNYKNMVKQLRKCDNINKIILPKMTYERYIDCNVLKQTFLDYGFKQIFVEDDIIQAFTKFYYKNKNMLFCCVGSLYLIGEVKKFLKGGKLCD